MDNYVDRADKVMRALSEEAQKSYGSKMVTTSQIRKFLTAVNRVNGKIDQFKNGNKSSASGRIPEDLQMEIKFLKVKLAYQIGRADSGRYRANPVKEFADKSGLIGEIDKIGDSLERYENFARYVEALVAFHKFYGGKD
ncbi:type III-A CRISPR-associated protein Csm2 [Dialister succinatiphilus]|jgi:CRISPR-associated protein Csm2|uniref:type III-A CRISPR-associated protein Csm2 n=1 Tax=Dialister succinatiphilus TaxID=487173 RepID=UPI0023554C17|nr:type III-A CRISPR-associated protein Csm2 [Dialister succinatiphilus]MCI6029969.1 type III-A CRISPR-associated protein Csm2 [Dialister succinatiphilus]